MTAIQRLATALTPLDAALALLVDGLKPVAPRELALVDALGSIAAALPPLQALPASDMATIDGWAFRSVDLVGASPWSPLQLATSPVWVEAGDSMPAGADCVLDCGAVERAGALFQVSAEAIPGQGVRRAGGDIAAGAAPLVAGRPLNPVDLLIARAVGRDRLAVRRPRLGLIDIPAKAGASLTARLIAESAAAAGADTLFTEVRGRDAQSIAMLLDCGECDLIVSIGGTGVGRSDATVAALAARGTVLAHGIALQPGRTAAIGIVAGTPVIALPGAPDQAVAGWWALVLPVLDRLSGRQPRPVMTLPLARKIASSVGIADIVLLRKTEAAWMPIAVGDLSLDALATADAWAAVPGRSEGYAAGTSVEAYMLRADR